LHNLEIEHKSEMSSIDALELYGALERMGLRYGSMAGGALMRFSGSKRVYIRIWTLRLKKKMCRSFVSYWDHEDTET